MQEAARTIVIVAIPFLVIAAFMMMLGRNPKVSTFYARQFSRLPGFIRFTLAATLVVSVGAFCVYIFLGSLIAALLHGAVSLFGPIPLSIGGYEYVISQIQVGVEHKLLLTRDGVRIWMPIFFAS